MKFNMEILLASLGRELCGFLRYGLFWDSIPFMNMLYIREDSLKPFTNMSRPPLLLLHGALGSQKQFNALSSELSPDHTIHQFDFEGHGGKAMPEAFSIDLFAENASRYLDANGLSKVDIFGYSMGGYVALKLAGRHPEKVGRIVTLGTKFDWSQETAEKEVRMLNPAKMEEKVPAFANFLAKVHGPNNWKEVVHKSAGMMLDLAAGNKLSAEALAGIDQEVLIIIGGQDNMVSIDESRQSAEALPNGRLLVEESFRHPIAKNDPARLAEIIRQFLAGGS